MDAIPTTANIEHYIRLVRDKSVLRQMISTATEIATRAYQEHENIETIVNEAHELVFKIGASLTKGGPVTHRDVDEASHRHRRKAVRTERSHHRCAVGLSGPRPVHGRISAIRSRYCRGPSLHGKNLARTQRGNERGRRRGACRDLFPGNEQRADRAAASVLQGAGQPQKPPDRLPDSR